MLESQNLGLTSDADIRRRRQLEKMLREARVVVRRLEKLLSYELISPPHPISIIRGRQNLSQRELALAVGISPPALSRIEHMPGFSGKKETRANIARILGVSEEELTAPQRAGSDRTAGRRRK